MLITKDSLDLVTKSWKVADPKALIVLTHGYNDRAGRYEHVGKALNEAGYSLYAYDLRGHGESGGQRGHIPSFNDFLDDLGLVVDDAKKDQPDKKVFVYGHSMGGNITLNYAIQRPEGLSGVIATSPWLRLAMPQPRFMVAIVRLLSAITPTISLGSNLSVAGISRDEAVQQAYLNDRALHGKITPRLLMEVTDNGLKALHDAKDLTLPVLLVHGTSDPITSMAATQAFYNEVPGDKTLKLYEDMRHETQNEFGKENVFKDIITWLNKHI